MEVRNCKNCGRNTCSLLGHSDGSCFDWEQRENTCNTCNTCSFNGNCAIVHTGNVCSEWHTKEEKVKTTSEILREESSKMTLEQLHNGELEVIHNSTKDNIYCIGVVEDMLAMVDPKYKYIYNCKDVTIDDSYTYVPKIEHPKEVEVGQIYREMGRTKKGTVIYIDEKNNESVLKCEYVCQIVDCAILLNPFKWTLVHQPEPKTLADLGIKNGVSIEHKDYLGQTFKIDGITTMNNTGGKIEFSCFNLMTIKKKDK